MRLLFTLIALTVATGVAGADDAPRAITLAEAVAAVEDAPLRRAADARTGAAAEEVPAAAAWAPTTLGVSTSARTTRLGLLWSMPLPVFGTLGAARRVARADFEVARAEASAVDLGLRRDVIRAWIELARAEAHAVAAEDGARREAELAVIAQARFDAGDVAHAEVVQADAGARRGRADADDQRAAITSASAELATALGWDPDALLHAEGGLPAAQEAPPLDQLRQRAGHPEARAAGLRVDAEGARLAEVHVGRRPVLAVELEASLDDPTLPGSDLRIGLSLEVPLFGKGGHKERAAAARKAAAVAERDATVSALDGALVAAYRRHDAARARARTLEDDVVAAQREAAALAQTAYREGEGDLASVIEADRGLAEVEAAWTDAIADAAIAHAELVWAAGGEL